MVEVLPSEELVDEASDFGHLRPGTRLGRYELLVPVARGGMARVWAARLIGQRGFQKLVAIKTILPHLASEPEFERMFLDEARIASGVHHPNVCEIIELGEEQRTLYLVMEWVSGDSFARVLRPAGRNEVIDPRVVARVIADACAGVHAAHEMTGDDGRPMNVVHRDLSPHNVLLSAEGFAKVCDFGVAKALGQLHEATSAGTLKGKVAYMSQEQVTAGAVDRRSDVFSLGIVLYEATTGMRPFRGDGEAQVMHALLKGEFDPPSSIIRSYPPELERIVTRALSPQPILRFPTAERMRFALEEFLAKGPLVTQSNVAQVLKARIGEALDKRKERIRLASTDASSDAPGATMTPSNANADANRSGVKPGPAAKPLFTTLQMDRPVAPPQIKTQPPPPMPASEPPMLPSETPQLGIVPPSPLSQTVAMPGAPVLPPPGFGAPVHTMPPNANASLAPNSAGPPSAGTYGGGYEPAPQVQQGGAGAGSYAIAAAVGVLVALLIGGGGWWAWHKKSAEPAPLITQAPPTPVPAQTAPASSEIVFRITPPDATLSVDGAELSPSTKVVARPAQGKSVMVVARAKGFEDTTVLVDWFTTSPMELALKPVNPPTIELGENTGGDKGEGATPPADSASAAPIARPKKPVGPAIPANPY